MTYEVLWVESKNDGWKIATIKEVVAGGQEFTEVSINKVDKKQRTFPRFDAIAPGVMIEGNMWQSPTSGKWTLYAPDEPRPAANATNSRPVSNYGGGKSAGVTKAQDRKEAGIEKAQDRKETGIMVAAAMRDSTMIANAIVGVSPEAFSVEDYQALFMRIKKWYLTEWKATEDAMDIPF